MTITGILILVAIGILLMLLEVFVIPGIGIAGIAGLLLLLVSIYLSYKISLNYGHMVLGGTVIASILLTIISLRAKTWERVSLKKSLTGKVNIVTGIKIGDKGIAISRLNPIGKARINDQLLEVKTTGDFIAENTSLSVHKIDGNSIIVKPITS